jgi:hypothetical protein
MNCPGASMAKVNWNEMTASWHPTLPNTTKMKMNVGTPSSIPAALCCEYGLGNCLVFFIYLLFSK